MWRRKIEWRFLWVFLLILSLSPSSSSLSHFVCWFFLLPALPLIPCVLSCSFVVVKSYLKHIQNKSRERSWQVDMLLCIKNDYWQRTHKIESERWRAKCWMLNDITLVLFSAVVRFYFWDLHRWDSFKWHFSTSKCHILDFFLMMSLISVVGLYSPHHIFRSCELSRTRFTIFIHNLLCKRIRNTQFCVWKC